MAFMNRFNATDNIHINSEGNNIDVAQSEWKMIEKNIQIFQIGCAFFYTITCISI